MNLLIRLTIEEDLPDLLSLYKEVSQKTIGLIRQEDEISYEYVEEFLTFSIEKGISLVAENESGEIIGEIHSYKNNIKAFSHVLSNLTIAVRPEHHSNGVGRSLFNELISYSRDHFPEIKRIELITRESNKKAINLYTSLGFKVEGCLKSRILRGDGTFENDIPMALML